MPERAGCNCADNLRAIHHHPVDAPRIAKPRLGAEKMHIGHMDFIGKLT